MIKNIHKKEKVRADITREEKHENLKVVNFGWFCWEQK